MTEELTQHREAYQAVMDELPDSVFVSHEDVDCPEWSELEVHFPTERSGCQTCGDPVYVRGLTVKCRDDHEVCHCGERYDQPKAAGCRRRKHVKLPTPEEKK